MQKHIFRASVGARYFAVTEGDFPKRLGIPLDVDQIEAPQEDPEIRVIFETERREKAASRYRHDHEHA